MGHMEELTNGWAHVIRPAISNPSHLLAHVADQAHPDELLPTEDITGHACMNWGIVLCLDFRCPEKSHIYLTKSYLDRTDPPPLVSIHLHNIWGIK
jgi:hypothetical protein